MGASDWHYTVAYQPDVKAALQQLRRDVYDRGEYYREPADNDLAMTEDEFRARLDPRGENDGRLVHLITPAWHARSSQPPDRSRPACPTRARCRGYSGGTTVVCGASWRLPAIRRTATSG